MPLPEPEPGLVIRYDYLWASEAAQRREHGKDRPACLVAASDETASPRFVLLLPITHTRPRNDTVGIAIPAAVCKAIGLDEQPCWVILSELNIDEWPSPSLAQIPGRRNVFAYGFLPPRLFFRIREELLARVRSGQNRPVSRR